MRSFVAILLITGILSSTFSKLYLFSNYILNKEFITQKFCENKAKPKLNCNGKCHLQKQLNEQDKKEGSSKNSMKDLNELQLFSESPEVKLDFFNSFRPEHNSIYLFKVLPEITHSFFHPPSC